MTNSIAINSKALVALNKNIASTEETRYYLNGVLLQFRAGKVIAVATDGHILASAVIGTYSDDFAHTGDVILSRDSLNRVKPARVGYETEEIDFSNPTKPILCGTVLEIIDGTFPEWRRIVPTETTDAYSHFDVALLARLQKVFVGFDAPRKASPMVSFNENGVALVSIYTETVPEAVGVMMGLRPHRDALTSAPDFISL